MLSVGEIIGRRVVMDGKTIGKVKEALIDVDRGEITFVITKGLLSKEVTFARAEDTNIGDFLIVEEDCLLESPPDVPTYSELLGKVVIEFSSGNAVGKVVDVRLDPDSKEIELVGKGKNEGFVIPTGVIKSLGDYVIVESVHPVKM